MADEPQEHDRGPAALLSSDVKVVNVGLESFARELAAGEVPVVHVEWSPPAGGDPALADLLSKLGV